MTNLSLHQSWETSGASCSDNMSYLEHWTLCNFNFNFRQSRSGTFYHPNLTLLCYYESCDLKVTSVWGFGVGTYKPLCFSHPHLLTPSCTTIYLDVQPVHDVSIPGLVVVFAFVCDKGDVMTDLALSDSTSNTMSKVFFFLGLEKKS